jgi:hypothetical protein
MTPHWHRQNPWRDQITYVPIERLAACVAGGTILDADGVVRRYSVAWLLAHWAQAGRDRLDAYILPQPDGRHSLGIRYGAEGSEYFSPHNAHPDKTRALLAEFHSDTAT